MAKTVTITLLAADAEPILRKAAEDAAKFGAWCDHITRRTVNAPGPFGGLDRPAWHTKFLAAKRTVEAFGVEYEPTSEEETLTAWFPIKGHKTVTRRIGGLAFNELVGGTTDYSDPRPEYRREVHAEACRQAADRVVRRWRESLEG